jgi:hypothetical protein
MKKKASKNLHSLFKNDVSTISIVEYLDFYDAFMSFMKVEKPTNNSRGRSRGMESKAKLQIMTS